MNKQSFYHFTARFIAASLVVMLVLAALPTNPAQAAPITYYVDNTNVLASDMNSGLTPDLPIQTIGHAAGLALAGDTVSVLAGTYPETVKPLNSGSAGNPVTFSAAPGVTVTGESGNATNGGGFRLFNKSYIVIDGFNITGTADYGIYVSTANHITISNNHVSYSGSAVNVRAGIYLTTTTNSSVIGNTTDHNTLDGIRLISGSNNNTVEKNISFGNSTTGTTRTAAGINLLANSNYNTIIRNIVYANEDTGLNFYTGSSHNIVVNNLTYGNGDHGIDNNAAPYNTFIGNTVHGTVTVGINLEQDLSGSGSGGAKLINNISVDNGYRRLVGGGTFTTGNIGNIRVDTTSLTSPAATTLDYDLVYSTTPDVVQIIWGGTSYTSMAAFKATGQEAHGLQANPLFTAPAPIAERPPAPPYSMAINIGDYHITAGSPAIDSANANAPSEQTVDIEGNPRVDDPDVTDTGTGTRTYDDRGAYEYMPLKAQTITWTSTSPADAFYAGPTYTPTATATSLLPVTISVDPTASLVCSITEGIVSFIGVGDCVLDADQAGDGIHWLPAPQVQQTFAVGKADQTITFDAPASPAVYNSTFDVTPTSDSGLEVTVTPSGACSILGSTVTMTSGTGTCTLTASQVGDDNYNPASDVVQTVTAQKADQTITFTPPASPASYNSAFEVTPTSDSGLEVAVTPIGACSILGSTVTMTSGTGLCALTASQVGDDNYNPATDVVQVVIAQKADQTITFISAPPPDAVTFGPKYTPLASSTSGLSVVIKVDAAASTVCSISAGGVVSFFGVGTCILNADQLGDDNYNAAPQVTQSFAVAQGIVKIFLPLIFR
jgi:parallel beta-helix repeat protein